MDLLSLGLGSIHVWETEPLCPGMSQFLVLKCCRNNYNCNNCFSEEFLDATAKNKNKKKQKSENTNEIHGVNSVQHHIIPSLLKSC